MSPEEKEQLKTAAIQLAEQILEDKPDHVNSFTDKLLETCEQVDGKDILIIHNPGGWGNTKMEGLLQWERSIIEGVSDTIGQLGYKFTVMQYFRSETGLAAVINDIREQGRFFRNKAGKLASELEFLVSHFSKLKIIMIGVSQGAAFSNSVVQHLDGVKGVSSIELGTPFLYKSKLVTTDNTLTVNSNGLMPDALMEWNIPVILKTYLTAPIRWLRYRLRGQKVKFTYCINLPGHDYNWDYPEVQGQIGEFLTLKLGEKKDREVISG